MKFFIVRECTLKSDYNPEKEDHGKSCRYISTVMKTSPLESEPFPEIGNDHHVDVVGMKKRFDYADKARELRVEIFFTSGKGVPFIRLSGKYLKTIHEMHGGNTKLGMEMIMSPSDNQNDPKAARILTEGMSIVLSPSTNVNLTYCKSQDPSYRSLLPLTNLKQYWLTFTIWSSKNSEDFRKISTAEKQHSSCHAL